ncbi:MAG: 50S ribosomal protein L34 [Candidatus Firestonebacteria bacterium]
MLPTYRPHNRKRHKTHGFKKRMKTHGGKKVLNSRRKKGRYRICV